MNLMNFDVIAFAAAVREIVCAVPAGKVTTYGDVAALAGYPDHARMAGRILASFGMDSFVPCHRVVSAAGRTAPHWHSQSALLRQEGVGFLPSGRVDMNRYRWKPDYELLLSNNNF